MDFLMNSLTMISLLESFLQEREMNAKYYYFIENILFINNALQYKL